MNIVEKQAKAANLNFPFAELPPSEYRLTKGASYPMLAAFRNMVATDSSGNATWQGGFKSVLRLWSEAGPELEEETTTPRRKSVACPTSWGRIGSTGQLAHENPATPAARSTDSAARKEGVAHESNDGVRKQMLSVLLRQECLRHERSAQKGLRYED